MNELAYMSDRPQIQISFRVRHPKRDPSEISNEVGWTVRRSWKIGEERKTPKGELIGGTYDETYCTFAVPASKTDQSISEYLEDLLQELSSRKGFLQEVVKEGGSNEFFVSWFSSESSGEVFSADLLKMFGDLSISLAIEFHPYALSH